MRQRELETTRLWHPRRKGCGLLGIAAALVAPVMFGATQAQAIPVLWELTAVTFDDGGTATGSFIFDADSRVYSNITITTSGGGLAGTSYDSVSPCCTGLVSSDAAVPLVHLGDGPDFIGDPVLFFGYSPLTNSGGIAVLVTSGNFYGEGICGDSECTGWPEDSPQPIRQITGGSLVGTVVPEPSTASLLALGLVLIAANRRRAS